MLDVQRTLARAARRGTQGAILLSPLPPGWHPETTPMRARVTSARLIPGGGEKCFLGAAMPSAAERKRAERAYKAAGLVRLPVYVDEADVSAFLVESGFLSPNAADDLDALASALTEALRLLLRTEFSTRDVTCDSTPSANALRRRHANSEDFE